MANLDSVEHYIEVIEGWVSAMNQSLSESDLGDMSVYQYSAIQKYNLLVSHPQMMSRIAQEYRAMQDRI